MTNEQLFLFLSGVIIRLETAMDECIYGKNLTILPLSLLIKKLKSEISFSLIQAGGAK